MVINKSTVFISAPARRVWDALTRPEFVKKWQYGSVLITDWTVGSGIRFRTEWEGTVFEQWGNILEVAPNRLIRYSLFAPRPGLEDKPENYFVMSYVLKKQNSGTLLEILQEDNRPDAVQEEPQGEGNPMLVALKNLVENEMHD